jgi:acetyl esterase/lipase
MRTAPTPFLAALVCAFATASAFAQAPEVAPEQVSLWNHHAPIGSGQFEDAEAVLTVHIPSKPSSTACIICPGGGYGALVMEAEGHGIARWLNTHGITGFVLQYRLPAGRPEVPLLDAQRAIRTVRTQANRWGIDPMKIGIVGFSAGGHLASTAGTHFDSGTPDAADPLERQSSRPDFMLLVYPVISMDQHAHAGSKARLLGNNPAPELSARFSNETQVTPQTPPAFLAHALDDTTVPPENSRAFQLALTAAGVANRYLELPSGKHGLNGYKGPMWDAWQEQSLHWLASQNFLPASQRPPH